MQTTDRKTASRSNNKSLSDLIDQFERRSSELAFLSFGKDRKKSLPYKELLHLIRRFSAGLKKEGIEKQDIVLLLSVNTPNLFISALSIIYTGAICVPVDPQSSDEVLAHIVNDCKPKLALADGKGLERLRKLKLGKKLPIWSLDEDEDEKDPDNWRARMSRVTNAAEIDEDDRAVIFYTSGTSGMPKGVPLTHANLMSQVEAIRKTKVVHAGDRLLFPLPLFHVYPFMVFLCASSLGIPIIIPKSTTGPEIMRGLKEGEATLLLSVPRLLRALYSGIEKKFREHKLSGAIFDGGRAISEFVFECTRFNIGKTLFGKVHEQFPKLRLFICGGAALDPELARNLRALGWQSAVGYGLTETSPLLTLRMPNNTDLESAGKVIPGVKLRFQKVEEETAEEGKNDKDDKDVKEEPQMEIQARGTGIFSGYLNLPDKTKETFTADGWFRTGDIGFLKNGNLHITGRISSQLKSEGGKKIQPDDLEEAYGKSPEIKEIGILQDDNKLVALVVPDPKAVGTGDATKKISEALQKAASGLPSYDRVSDFAISKQPLPRTNIGKLRRPELIEQYEKAKTESKSGKPKGHSSEEQFSSEDRALLDDPIAKQCWEWLKERFPDADLSFDTAPSVDLNIDSLEWVNLSLEIRDRLGVDLTEDAIGRIETVRDLLKEITDAAQSGDDAISPFEEPEKILDNSAKQFLKPLSPAMTYMSYLMFLANAALMRTLFKVEAIGLKNVPTTHCVLTPNHASYLDALALAAVLPFERLHKTHWAGWAGIAFATPINTFVYRLAQSIPIEASKSLMSSLALGSAVLKRRKNLVWFPEGTRTMNGRLLPFKPGIGMILEHFDVPVVPILIHGSRQALPPGRFWPTFRKIEVIFGEPKHPDELAKLGEGDNVPQQIANALHDQVQALRDARNNK